MAKKDKLRIIPLGGVDEIGKNLTVIECGDDIIIVDCGSMFPHEDLLGIDLVIPDISYLIENKNKIKGFVFTHGHEDHIGAIPYVMSQLQAPLYGSKFTMSLVDIKLKEHRLPPISLNNVNPGQVIKLGCFSIKFVNVNHSIPGAMALIIKSPAGTVIHTGDFKIDYTPIKGSVTDLTAFAEASADGVLALLCESTNVEHEGHTLSESKIAETFETLFEEAYGRIVVAMFASNVYRIQMAVNSAIRYGRKICFIGRSMINVARVSMEIGELEIPEGWLIEPEEVDNYRDDQILIITTGSQGEPMAGLTRMAFGEHRKIRIRPTDTVILSSSPIPGNEKNTARVLNQLYRCGAHVIYNSLAEVHSSGHACKEELRIIHTLVKPKYFIPVHGEYRMLWQHAELGEALGMPPANIIIPETGQVIEMTEKALALGETVQSGSLMVDGLCIGDVGNAVLRDRRHLSQDGIIIVA
ncbi:MAG: ribonuclease J, partial [Christensenellaceae bacterium]|nr:ribonuclease J [Christensenellaceae bacterium]